jgi:hypothetical protein
MEAKHETFLPLQQAALRLGVPAAWLRAEAKADRIPALRAGRRLLFNIPLVQRSLLARAQRQGAADDR